MCAIPRAVRSAGALLLALGVVLLAPRASAGLIVPDFDPTASGSALVDSLGAPPSLPPRSGPTAFHTLGAALFDALDAASPGPELGVASADASGCRGAPCGRADGALGADLLTEAPSAAALPPFDVGARGANRGASFLLQLPFTFVARGPAATGDVQGNEVARVFPAAPAGPRSRGIRGLILFALLALGLASLAGARLRRTR